MRVAVFGASGKVGLFVTNKLLIEGHDVIVFTHKSSPFKESKRLKIIHGDIHNFDEVRQAVRGSQAVVSALGSWGTKSKDIVSSGIENIITAMSENNIKRVVSLTGSDALASSDHSSILGRLLRFIIIISPARKILFDGEKHIKLLEKSELDWTVLRSPVMNNKGNLNNFVVSKLKPKLWQTINRESVANALVELIEDNDYYQQAPYIKRVNSHHENN